MNDEIPVILELNSTKARAFLTSDSIVIPVTSEMSFELNKSINVFLISQIGCYVMDAIAIKNKLVRPHLYRLNDLNNHHSRQIIDVVFSNKYDILQENLKISTLLSEKKELSSSIMFELIQKSIEKAENKIYKEMSIIILNILGSLLAILI